MPDPYQFSCVSQPEGESTSESGYMLVAVIVMTALVLIALSAAAPIISKDLRRDKEVESEHRAEQYVRAIRLYYRKTHAYPPSIEALKNTNNVRFLRQEYVDPLTGKSDWKLIHLGEQKTTVKGFFGQELGGIGSGGGLGSAAGMSSGIGTPIGGAGSSSQNCVTGGTALTGGFTGACQTTTTGAGGSTGTTGSTGSTSAFGSSGSTGSSGGLGGGGAIIGVSTARTGSSMTQPNQQSTYESWEFWYDPRIEQMYQKGITNMGIGGGAPGSTPASSFGAGPGGLTSGSSFSNSPTSGTSPGSLSSPTSGSPTTTTTPQP
jgi:type II secretory pathway pseudopilin PulG